MRLVHRPPAGGARTLATRVETADAPLTRARGLMFRRSVPDDYALAFRFRKPERRSLHMLFVPFSIDAVWCVDGRVERVKRLRPWVGIGWAAADAVYELPAGAAAGVEPGDELALE